MTTGKGVAAETGDDGGSIDVSRPEWLPGVGTEQDSPIVDRDSLPPDDAFEILRNPRRRHALRVLTERNGALELTDLAATIASIENDKHPDDVSATERKRVYISLYQCHVSKMVEAGAVEYDPDTRIVEITSDGVELADVLAAFGDDRRVGSRVHASIAAVAVLLSIAAFYGSIPGLAMLFLGIAVSSAATCYLAWSG